MLYFAPLYQSITPFLHYLRKRGNVYTGKYMAVRGLTQRT
nr:MAG TPA: hypothetical protein [Caudoviricetes sp.]DAS52492.1 MAG TPA: hypothetical protein [Caudoviricetes sp.]